jgi:anthranilate phosphoribosyltransferase
VSVYGLDGMDEISASDKTFVCELKDGKTMSYEISPEYFGMAIISTGKKNSRYLFVMR